MLKIKDIEGVVHEVEGIDVNVFDGRVFGDDEDTFDGAILVAYPMHKDADGIWQTYTGVTLFRAETDFDPDLYYDEWYGFSDENTPGDVPFEVNVLVNNIMAEVKVP